MERLEQGLRMRYVSVCCFRKGCRTNIVSEPQRHLRVLHLQEVNRYGYRENDFRGNKE